MFRLDDMEKINYNMKSIIDKAAEEYKSTYEPTLNEISDIYKIIKEYIIKKKRVIYGGYAQNLLLKVINPELTFYIEKGDAVYNWPDIADIEIYSNEPFLDVVNLTEELYSKGYKYIEGKEGIHEGTYKIYVNYENYCDISYIPTQLYNNLPIININNMLCVHPHFMMVDAYRIITDPMTSYWRLNKSLQRFNSLIQNYPINTELIDNAIKPIWKKNIDLTILKFIRNNIIKKSKLIVIGFYAYNYYIKKQNINDIIKIYPYYELISSDISEDAKKIYNILSKKYDKKNITIKEYYPFFTFYDNRIEYYINNNLILILYGNNKRCIVYNNSKKKKTYFGTSSLVFMYLLFNYYYYYINKNKIYVDYYNILISKFFYNKNKYLTDRKLTVLDNSPFKDFIYKCIGFPIEPKRQSFMEKHLKKKLGKRIQINYTPTGKIKEHKEMQYNNISGNQIFLEKNLILKNI